MDKKENEREFTIQKRRTVDHQESELSLLSSQNRSAHKSANISDVKHHEATKLVHVRRMSKASDREAQQMQGQGSLQPCRRLVDPKVRLVRLQSNVQLKLLELSFEITNASIRHSSPTFIISSSVIRTGESNRRSLIHGGQASQAQKHQPATLRKARIRSACGHEEGISDRRYCRDDG